MGITDSGKKLTKKQKIVLAGTAAAVALLIAAFVWLRPSSSGDSERKNTLTLVQMYMDKGEYDRAMNLLDSLLVKNAQDKDALSLMNKVISLKDGKKQDSSSEKNPDVNVNIDTSGITKAVESSINSMKDELAKNNAEAQQNQKAMADISMFTFTGSRLLRNRKRRKSGRLRKRLWKRNGSRKMLPVRLQRKNLQKRIRNCRKK